MQGWINRALEQVDTREAEPSLVPGLGALALGQEKARQNGWLSPSRELVAQDQVRNRRREVRTPEEFSDCSEGPDLSLAVEKRLVCVARLHLPQKAPHGRFERRVVGRD